MEKKLAELIARMKKVSEDQQAIEKEATLNNEGVFTDEQRSSYEALDVMFAELQKQKEGIEKQMTLMATRQDRADSLAPFSLRRSSPNSGAPVATQPNGTPIQANSDNDHSEPRAPRFTIPASVRRVTPRHFRGVQGGLDGEHRAYRFGMWALATLSRQVPSYNNDEGSRAIEFVRAHMQPTNTAHGGDVTTGGHFLIPEEFSRDLIDLREQYGVARRLFSVVNMGSDTWNVPKRSSGLTAYFNAENAAGTESNMTWANIQLVTKKLTAISRMSEELSADSIISIGDTLAGEMSYAFAEKEDQCAFNGDGTDTYGAIVGCRPLLDGIYNAGTDLAGLIDSATSNTWSAIVLSDFNAVIAKLPAYADTRNVVWVCHRTFFYQVMNKLEAAAGGNTMYELMAGERSPRPMFLGYPVEFSQVFPSATATSSVVCLLGDFKAGALFGDRAGTTIKFSEHAAIGGESVFERGQIAVRGVERFDINVHGCGTASVAGPIVGLTTGA